MKKTAIICVGKLKTGFWKDAAAHYHKLISCWRSLEIREIRDCAGPQRVEKEAAAILKVINPGECLIALTEDGKNFTSRQFASFLGKNDESGLPQCFIIGGPFGLGGEVLRRCPVKLSLSAMTWPHELARVLLLEQLYRAESILRATPYHHD